jgi:hypothetical protein
LQNTNCQLPEGPLPADPAHLQQDHEDQQARASQDSQIHAVKVEARIPRRNGTVQAHLKLIL